MTPHISGRGPVNEVSIRELVTRAGLPWTARDTVTVLELSMAIARRRLCSIDRELPTVGEYTAALREAEVRAAGTVGR